MERLSTLGWYLIVAGVIIIGIFHFFFITLASQYNTWQVQTSQTNVAQPILLTFGIMLTALGMIFLWISSEDRQEKEELWIR